MSTGAEINQLKYTILLYYTILKEWQMLFNAEKYKVMHIGFNNSNALYSMGNITLSEVNEEKDLGHFYKRP